jgi:hypothetical protein
VNLASIGHGARLSSTPEDDPRLSGTCGGKRPSLGGPHGTPFDNRAHNTFLSFCTSCTFPGQVPCRVKTNSPIVHVSVFLWLSLSPTSFSLLLKSAAAADAGRNYSAPLEYRLRDFSETSSVHP